MLVVGGGKGGGSYLGGGGGAGGYTYNSSIAFPVASYPITVGAGGVGNAQYVPPSSNSETAGTKGGNSVITHPSGPYTVEGGGYGAGYNPPPNSTHGGPGGSGGGGNGNPAGGNGWICYRIWNWKRWG